MKKTRHEVHWMRRAKVDDEDLDDNGVLRDGGTVRIPVMVADAAAVEVEDDVVVADEDYVTTLPNGTVIARDDLYAFASLAGRPGAGYGLSPARGAANDAAVQHVPGYVDARRATQDAYSSYEERITSAHRRPPPAAGSSRRSPIAAWSVDEAAASTDAVLARTARASDVAAHLEDVRDAADAEYRTRLEAASRR